MDVLAIVVSHTITKHILSKFPWLHHVWGAVITTLSSFGVWVPYLLLSPRLHTPIKFVTWFAGVMTSLVVYVGCVKKAA